MPQVCTEHAQISHIGELEAQIGYIVEIVSV
jgi:hypothetical protein